jgi:hypothetical protein
MGSRFGAQSEALVPILGGRSAWIGRCAATLVDGGDLASMSLENGVFVAAELDVYPADQTGMLRARSSAIGP